MSGWWRNAAGAHCYHTIANLQATRFHAHTVLWAGDNRAGGGLADQGEQWRRIGAASENNGGVADERALFAGPVLTPVPSDAARAHTPSAPVDSAAQTNTSTEPDARTSAHERPKDRPAHHHSPRRWQLPRRTAIARRWSQALETETAYGTPFLLVPLCLLFGVTIYFALPIEPAPHNIVASLVLMTLLWLVSRDRLRPMARGALGIVLVLTGMAIGQAHTQIKATPMLGSEVATQLTGRVVRMERRPNGSVRYTLDVLKTERPVLRYAPDRVRVTARNPLEGVRAGDGLQGRAQLRPPSSPVRPGSYDFAFHNYFAGLGANGFFYGAPEVVAVAPPEGLRARAAFALQNARTWLSDRIRTAVPNQNGIVAAALITGDRTAISDEINESLRVSGLAHILTISGLHMALVAGTVLVVLRAGFALFPGFSARHPTHKYAAVAALGAVFIYLFLAGASIATQRAFIMLSVMLVALMLDRRAISKRNLAIAAILIIVMFPSAVVGPSFHMSFAATLALIALYDVWNRHRRERRAKRPMTSERPNGPISGAGLWRFFAALAATSLVAGTASGLYAAYHFNRVATLGLVTNLAAMPIVSVVTMPLAIIATLAIPFGLDGYLYAAMAASVGWILVISDAIAVRSPPGHIGVMSVGVMLAASVALIWVCVCRTRLRWLAVIPALFAIALAGHRSDPIIVISEDGRQVAAIGLDGQIALNRSRPSAFIVDQWQKAYRTPHRLRPFKLDEGVPLPTVQSLSTLRQADGFEATEAIGATGRTTTTGSVGTKDIANANDTSAAPEPVKMPHTAVRTSIIDNAPRSQDRSEAHMPDPIMPMTCSDVLCQGIVGRAGTQWPYLIASADTQLPVNACKQYAIIILAYAPSSSPCAVADRAHVITAQHLSLRGSAEIFVGDKGVDLRVRHAVAYPFRPWHDQRQYSRSARNLAPWR